MAQFRSKPKTIEAVQWDLGNNHHGVRYDNYYIGAIGSQPPQGRHYVVTIHHQRAYLDPGDWIVNEPPCSCGSQHHYPVKPEIFSTSYEPVLLEAPSDDSGITVPGKL